MLLAIHDLSSLGRSSLGVIIPTVAALGVQPVAIPTAVLSAHTGGLGTPATVPLTPYLWDTLAHFKTLEIAPKGIYTGYLAGAEQGDCCSAFFSQYPKALRIVDPVLGDGGRAYTGITQAHIDKMKELVGKSQVLLPNITECSLLLGQAYQENPTLGECEKYIEGLRLLGAKSVVIKGISLKNGELGNLVYDGESRRTYLAVTTKLPASFPGTGDIFASVVAAALVQGKSVRESVSMATAFLGYTLKKSIPSKDTRYGVELERCLPWLYNPHYTNAKEIISIRESK